MNLDEAVKMMQAVALRGFSSEPVQVRWDKGRRMQYVVFTEEEKRGLHLFLGHNQHLARIGRREIPSILGINTTLSLLGRINYALNYPDITPEYVAGLAVELLESKDSPLWGVAELERMMR